LQVGVVITNKAGMKIEGFLEKPSWGAGQVILGYNVANEDCAIYYLSFGSSFWIKNQFWGAAKVLVLFVLEIKLYRHRSSSKGRC
jgi:hypothetical protein